MKKIYINFVHTDSQIVLVIIHIMNMNYVYRVNIMIVQPQNLVPKLALKLNKMYPLGHSLLLYNV